MKRKLTLCSIITGALAMLFTALPPHNGMSQVQTVGTIDTTLPEVALTPPLDSVVESRLIETTVNLKQYQSTLNETKMLMNKLKREDNATKIEKPSVAKSTARARSVTYYSAVPLKDSICQEDTLENISQFGMWLNNNKLGFLRIPKLSPRIKFEVSLRK